MEIFQESELKSQDDHEIPVLSSYSKNPECHAEFLWLVYML